MASMKVQDYVKSLEVMSGARLSILVGVKPLKVEDCFVLPYKKQILTKISTNRPISIQSYIVLKLYIICAQTLVWQLPDWLLQSSTILNTKKVSK